MRSSSITASSKMIGEMSMPPVLGRKLRIGRKNGSVSARNRFQTARTKSLRMLTTPNAISQDSTAPAMITSL